MASHTSLPPPMNRLARSSVTNSPPANTKPASPPWDLMASSNHPTRIANAAETRTPNAMSGFRCQRARPGLSGTQLQ